ncbi:hypothetical protein J4732_10860 [Serratia marcescens]|uniref:Uncharacterized protein n=1 Tax=Serratia marcescens TaxID=615 RepID=A0A939NRG7_SERMA|nr:hypothetical protein [Serratia marcescens]
MPFPVSNITPAKAQTADAHQLLVHGYQQQSECARDPATNDAKARDVVNRLTALKRTTPACASCSPSAAGTTQRSGRVARQLRQRGENPGVAHQVCQILRAHHEITASTAWTSTGYPQASEVDGFIAALQEIRTLLNQQTVTDGRRALPYQLTIAGAGGAFPVALLASWRRSSRHSITST